MSVLNVTRGDNSRSFEVNRGDLIEVRLEENGATPYTWAPTETDPGILALERDDFELPTEPLFGGPGERVLTFRTKATGSVQISLKHWCEWEGDASIQDRFGVTIVVNE